MTTFYLIRHGESEANLARIFTGSSNFKLTEKGQAQAKLAAEFLKDKNIDAVYASPLNRAYNTGKAVSDLLDIPLYTNDGLKEINAGIWEGKKFDDLETEFLENYYIWRNDIGKAAPDGGETVAELYDRVVSAVISIAEENDGKNIVLATHATPVRALGAYAMGITKENLKDISWAGNASITTVKYENGKFFDVEYGFIGHLGDIATGLPSNV